MQLDAYVYEAIRTPRGAGTDAGSLRSVKPIELLAQLYQALTQRTGINPAEVGDILLGCNTAFGDQGADIAKISALYAGWPDRVPGATVNRFCASAFDAINTAAMQVSVGAADLVVAGGVESMSRVPMLADKGAWFADSAVAAKTGFVHMGVAADALATAAGLSRELLDELAYTSHQRAAIATQEQRFGRAVIPIHDEAGEEVLAHDETIRASLTPEKLAGLPEAFSQMGATFDPVVQAAHPALAKVQHLHTVASSPGMVDAASMLLIGNAGVGVRLGLTPLAKIRSFANVASDPTLMLTGPGPAARSALAKVDMSVRDVDLFECNESFAATVAVFEKDLNLDHDIVNVNGGAMAMGHPLGATGGILLATLIDELRRQGQSIGVATIPAGAGLATATVVEVV
ncbi:MAG: acetyl-CoA C-acyltransferase [Actinomycetia bacterium]|nr:acetyl-CoA C-acyltransferase [Actinomycetes bacterium]